MILEVEGLTHGYGGEPAIEDVSFGLESGELVALLGPSGCGKTTIVQAIAGHLEPTGGRVRLRGEDVTGTPPESRRVGVVFQEPTLYPHMTVRENVTYGLAAGEGDAERRDELADRYLDLVDLRDQADARPSELSGGQKRRGELARALAPRPDVLLLDEPLSALDRTLRERLRAEIARIQRETGVTTLVVTHDQDAAMALADRLVVLDDGRVAGVGDPRALYESPPNPFVASFLGRSNAVPATVVDREPPSVELGGTEIRLPDSAVGVPPGSDVTCHVRPRDVSLRPDGPLTGEVTDVADVGRRYDVTVRLPGGQELLAERPADPPAVGEHRAVELEEVTLFDHRDTRQGPRDSRPPE